MSKCEKRAVAVDETSERCVSALLQNGSETGSALASETRLLPAPREGADLQINAELMRFFPL